MNRLQKFEKTKIDQQINKKWVRILTVLLYVISVSLVAVILGLYYRFYWKADYSNTGLGSDFESVKIATFKIPRKFNNKTINVSEYLEEVFNRLKVKGFNVSVVINNSKQQYFESNYDQYEFELNLMV
jgi:hypothetical protein